MVHTSSVQPGESKPYDGRRKEKTTGSSWAVEIPISASESSRGGAMALSVVGVVIARAEAAPEQVASKEVGAAVAPPGADDAAKQPTQHATQPWRLPLAQL